MIAAKARRVILDIVYSPEGVKTIKADCRRASTQEHPRLRGTACLRPKQPLYFKELIWSVNEKIRPPQGLEVRTALLKAGRFQHGATVASECPVTAPAPSDIGVGHGQRHDTGRP